MRRQWGVTLPTGGRPRSGRRVAGGLLVAFLAAGGGGLLTSGLTTAGPPRPPQPDPEVAPGEYGLTAASLDEPDAGGEGLPPASPERVRIPAIEVDSELLTLGVDNRGEVEVPPLRHADRAGWYSHGVTPGEVGNAVIIGHVDSRARGPAVFFDLGRLRPGDQVEVFREDGSRARFEVDGVATFPKRDFPVELVYGPAPRPGLRLITCGGEFDDAAGDYRDNVVVFATLAEP